MKNFWQYLHCSLKIFVVYLYVVDVMNALFKNARIVLPDKVIAGDEELKEWYHKIFDYVFSVFPNPNREGREWVQIQTREGKPQEAIVALPVKDPMHIARNMIYTLRFLYSLEN